ncbi:hypothetical protein FACS1894139_17080 [Planctomycetales bacterium]|nr:hypothetical protein FACS1894107_13780 [Planctomycetales bacterium]GHT00683.1 hypothetical protein FACS1894108_13330 [Planctomycetales bacterium]GHT07983.1 hypothetical protein FACS1894139_17080 [Planctomycetales bacterium]GHV22127.1 hypothetical protein AGMMS49959_12420 [Planctomycetales bacterium]
MSKRRKNSNPSALPNERHNLFAEAEQQARTHRWIESEKARRDLGYDAIKDWYRKYWWTFCRERFIEHLLGQRFWTELDDDNFALIGQRFAKDDPLIAAIVDIFARGGENLDVIQYALANRLNLEEMAVRLELFDINAARLPPNVAVTETEFIDNIRSRRRRCGLIVDPDETTRRLLQEMLSAAKLAGVAVATVGEALDSAAKKRFDVFFVELNLPERLGIEVADALARRGIKTRVAAMSGQLADWREDDLRDCGFTDILPKPLDRAAVKEILDSLPNE